MSCRRRVALRLRAKVHRAHLRKATLLLFIAKCPILLAGILITTDHFPSLWSNPAGRCAISPNLFRSDLNLRHSFTTGCQGKLLRCDAMGPNVE